MRILLVINPYATNYDIHLRRVVEKALAADHDVEVIETSRHGHGLPLSQGAVSRGLDAVIAWGGDGTVNEVANGLAGSDVALGIIPGGSTNVAARSLGIPNDVTVATGLLINWLAQNRSRRIGLARAGERYFTFSCGVGLDAAIVNQVEMRSMLKRTIGPSVYLAATLAVLQSGFDRHKPHLRIEFDDGSQSPPLFLVIACTSKMYTYWGNMPMVLTPNSDHDRPPEFFGMTELGIFTTFRKAVSSFSGAQYLRNSPSTYLKTANHAVIKSEVPMYVHTDAEYRGLRDEVEITWEPSVLSVYC